MNKNLNFIPIDNLLERMIDQVSNDTTVVIVHSHNTVRLDSVLMKLPRYEPYEKQLAEKAKWHVGSDVIYRVSLGNDREYAVSFRGNYMMLGLRIILK